MASSRLEKIGTIFTRVEGLLKRGVIKVEDRPLWFDVYRAFPPLEEPTYSRPVPKIPLKPIFYKEDEIRAKFHSAGLGTSGYKLGANSGLGGQGGTRKYLQHYQQMLADNEGATAEELIARAATSVGEEFQDFRATSESLAPIGARRPKELASETSVSKQVLQESNTNKVKSTLTEADINNIFDKS